MRLLIIKAITVIFFIVLIVGLFNVQILHGDYYTRLSENNRIRLIPIESPRGRIYDREKVILAGTRPSYDVAIMPQDFTQESLPVLSEILGMSSEDIKSCITRSKKGNPFMPVVVKKDVSKEQVFCLEERRLDIPGLVIQTGGIRYYPHGEIASHVLGYIGKINEEEYENRLELDYDLNDYVGRMGIEKIYDRYLRGEDGGKQIEVDYRGREVSVLGEKEPKAGNDLELTIDVRLQNKIYDVLGESKGTICLLDLKNDEILALVSRPGYDPNIFVSPAKSKERLSVLSDRRNLPMINRSASIGFPPGSVFKLVTAIAGLESGKLKPYTTFTCTGAFRLNPRSRAFKCWYSGGHGKLDLYGAIERSCNVYFYNAGRLIGENKIAEYARILGLGEEVDIGLTNIHKGIVPDAEWKFDAYREKWYAGDTVNYAIGQGYVLVTPLQILRLVAIIAKGGEWSNLHIVKGKKIKNKKLPIKKENIKIIKQAMRRAVESNYGTAQYARVDFTSLAGKTGTAQAPPGETHAWFVGFFPYEKPEIALVVFLERGGSGGGVAAKFAAKALEAWREFKEEAKGND